MALFKKKKWTNNGVATSDVPTPPAIDADNLNRIEDGIEEGVQNADKALLKTRRFCQIEIGIDEDRNANSWTTVNNGMEIPTTSTQGYGTIIVPEGIRYVKASVYAYADSGSGSFGAAIYQTSPTTSGTKYIPVWMKSLIYNSNWPRCAEMSVIIDCNRGRKLYLDDYDGGTLKSIDTNIIFIVEEMPVSDIH